MPGYIFFKDSLEIKDSAMYFQSADHSNVAHL